MLKIFVLGFVLFISSCSSTKVKRIGDKKYPPLSPNAPVHVFSSRYPDLKYEEICQFDLKRNTTLSFKFSASDYHDDLREEARKCGANGVLVKYSFKFGRGITIRATGIKITSEEKKISKKDIKKLSLATQSNNLNVLKKILKNVNQRRSKRAPTDTALIDSLFYIYARKGPACRSDIVNFFKSYEAIVPEFNHISFYGDGLSDENIIFCKDVLKKSFPKIEKKNKFAIALNNHFVSFIEYMAPSDKNLNLKLDGFNEIFKVVIKEMAKSCAQDETNELCIMKPNFLAHRALLGKAMKRLKPRTRPYNRLKELDNTFKKLMI